MYARLPPEPQRKEPEIDLYPDTQEDGSKSGFSNYLDEFLSAIKVFGYLERPVFHELTRSMQTRKLIAGETLNLEEEKGFCLVVDGMVEIFVKSSREGRGSDSEPSSFHNDDSSDSGEGQHGRNAHQGYQLLTEVKNGAPMSSLFSILSLFTEDVKLRHTEDDDPDSTPSTGYGHGRFPSSAGLNYHHSHDTPPSLPTSPIYGAPSQTGRGPPRDRRSSTMASSTAGGTLPRVPPLSLDANEEHCKPRPKPRRTKTTSAHPDIVARATVDTTIAIIPASAFRRLTRVYPKATAHIVQVILTRLQRVTLATGHSYLGLTSEVLRTEKHMNKYTTYELPNFLRGDALERLKEKFIREKERIRDEDSSKGIALHNSGAGRRRGSNNSLRKEATLHALSQLGSSSVSGNSVELPSRRETGAIPSPGDLLTNIQMSRSGGRRGPSFSEASPSGLPGQPQQWQHDLQSPLAQRSFNPFATQLNPRRVLHRQESVDEDSMFRGSILECIFKAIGLTNKKVSSTVNLRTVAILPVTAGVPVVEFGSRLMNALSQIGATNGVTSLNQAAILNHLGRHAFSRMGKLKLSQYLADLEEKYGLVLYVAGMSNLPFPCSPAVSKQFEFEILFSRKLELCNSNNSSVTVSSSKYFEGQSCAMANINTF